MAEMKAADAAAPPPGDDDAPGGNMPAPELAPEAPEAPAAEEVPETEDAPAAPDAGKPRRDTKAPVSALHEEREKRRALERTNAEEKAVHVAELARTQERLNLLAAAVQEASKPPPPAAPAPEPIPDFDTDPAGHIRATFKAQQDEIRGLREALGQHGQHFQQMDQQRQQATAHQQLAQWTLAQEQALAASNPEYDPARQHLINVRHQELEAMGYTDPAARQQIIGQDVLQLATQAAQQRGNFAQMVLALSKARGFVMPAAPVAEPPVVEPAAPATREAAQERGRDMALTLGSGGGAPRGALTADNLARMGDADFEAVLAKAKKDPAAMRALFGA